MILVVSGCKVELVHALIKYCLWKKFFKVSSFCSLKLYVFFLLAQTELGP